MRAAVKRQGKGSRRGGDLERLRNQRWVNPGRYHRITMARSHFSKKETLQGGPRGAAVKGDHEKGGDPGWLGGKVLSAVLKACKIVRTKN